MVAAFRPGLMSTMNERMNQARWVAMLAFTAIALYLCWLMLKPFVDVLGWAVILVIIFYPVHRRLAPIIKRPGLTALASCLLVVMVFVVPLTFAIVALRNELGAAPQNLPEQVAEFVKAQAPVIRKISLWLHDRISFDAARSSTLLTEQLNNLVAALLGHSMGLAGDVLSVFFKAFFVMFTMYYLFRDGNRIVQALPGVLPFKKSQSEALIGRVEEVVGAGVYGVVSIATIQGLLAGLGFWILGVPSPVLWAVLTAFVCMIPIAASFFVWLPASIYLIATGHLTKGVLLIIWGALVISIIDNFLRPKLIRKQTKLHELFIFFSVLGGIKVFGLIGIVVGPVVLAITLGLIETFRKQNEHTGDLLHIDASSPSKLSSRQTVA